MFNCYSMFHFVVTHCVSLLPIMLYYCSCFDVVLGLVTTFASLLLLLHYNRWVTTPSLFATLLPSQVPLCSLLFHCPSMLLYSLTQIGTPPFLAGCWKFRFGFDWEEVWKHPSSKLLISFFCCFFSLQIFFLVSLPFKFLFYFFFTILLRSSWFFYSFVILHGFLEGFLL